MKNYQIAWRNLWRNRRRTLITTASVFFAVFFALVMRAWQLGTYDHMFRNTIESYTGYIQVQNEEFWDDKTVDNTFEFTTSLEESIGSVENCKGVVPRFESFALASSGSITKGVLVMGIDPSREALLSDIRNRLVKFTLDEENLAKLKASALPEQIKRKLDIFKGYSYSSEASLAVDLDISDSDSAFVNGIFRENAFFRNGYFELAEKSVLVGDKLAKFLKVNIGDTIVLLGQGYHGAGAAGKFRVNGIVKLPTPDIDNKIVYLPYDVCQDLFNAPGRLTSLAVAVNNNSDSDIDETIAELNTFVKSPLKVMGWREMNKLLINQMDADSKSGMIMIVILYMVIAFGIFGTVLMMTAERRREFGVLVAIGMQKTKLSVIVAIEILYTGLMGILAGTVVSLPVIFWGHYNPIRFHGEMGKMYEDYGMEAVMPFMLPDTYVLWQSVTVAVIVLIALIYPLRKISKMQVVNSLKA